MTQRDKTRRLRFTSDQGTLIRQRFTGEKKAGTARLHTDELHSESEYRVEVGGVMVDNGIIDLKKPESGS